MPSAMRERPAMTAAMLERRLHWLSAGAVCSAAVGTVLSWALAAYLPTIGRQACTVQMLLDIGPSWASPYISGWPLLDTPEARAAAYFLPVITWTVLALGLCLTLLRHRQLVTRATTDALFRRALLMAPVCLLAMPLFTKDLWLSVGFGRMIAAGVNPYHTDLAAEFVRGLPIDLATYGERMTYGPLWATMAGAVAWLARGVPAADFLLTKAVFAAAWIGALVALRAAGRACCELHGALAVTLWGFLPAGVTLGVAEGHNDIVLALFLSIWVWATVSRTDWARPVALAGSILTKYVTLPAAIIDLLTVPLSRKVNWRHYGVGALLAVLVSGLLFAVLLGNVSSLAATREMQAWDWWTPDLALVDVAAALGLYVDRWNVSVAMFLVGLGAVVFTCARIRKRHDVLGPLDAAEVAELLVVLLLVGHIWPWFVLWVLPPAVLLWDRWAGRVALALLTAVPVLNVAWIAGQTGPMLGRRGPLVIPPHVMLYGLTLIALVASLALTHNALDHKWAPNHA